jgi:hypothetical protein
MDQIGHGLLVEGGADQVSAKEGGVNWINDDKEF